MPHFVERITTLKKEIDELRTQYGDEFTIRPCEHVLESLTLNFPGMKPSPYDYRLELDGKALTHKDIVYTIYNFIARDPSSLFDNSEFITDFLENIFKQGLNFRPKHQCNIDVMMENDRGSVFRTLTVEEFKHLIYWLVLQEDINYPRSKGYFGVKLPFYRYIEAAIAANHPDLLTLEEVIENTDFEGRTPQNAFSDDRMHGFLLKRIRAIG